MFSNENLNVLKFGCNLYIYTKEQHPEIITTLTGINSTRLIVKGQPKINPISKKPIQGTVNKVNLWVYEFPNVKGVSEWHIEDAIRLVFQLLEKKNEFKNILEVYDESYLLVYLYTQDYHVAYNLPKDILEKLHYFGLRIEFDIYYLREDNNITSKS